MGGCEKSVRPCGPTHPIFITDICRLRVPWWLAGACCRSHKNRVVIRLINIHSGRPAAVGEEGGRGGITRDSLEGIDYEWLATKIPRYSVISTMCHVSRCEEMICGAFCNFNVGKVLVVITFHVRFNSGQQYDEPFYCSCGDTRGGTAATH